MEKNKELKECKAIKDSLINIKSNNSNMSELTRILSEERKKNTKLIVPMHEEKVQFEDDEEPEIFARACPVINNEGYYCIAAFTSSEEYNMNDEAIPYGATISEIMLTVTMEGYAGVILNPGSDNIFIPEDVFMKL